MDMSANIEKTPWNFCVPNVVTLNKLSGDTEEKLNFVKSRAAVYDYMIAYIWSLAMPRCYLITSFIS